MGSHEKNTAEFRIISEKLEKTELGERVEREVSLANDYVEYALNYDITRASGGGGKVVSPRWVWNDGYITLGISRPFRQNWYFHGFLKWVFGGISLHEWEADFRIRSGSGDCPEVEYLWDLPEVRASLVFALPAGYDKLVMIGNYEVKKNLGDVRLEFSCYPRGFDEPGLIDFRHLQATTKAKTRDSGRFQLDPAKESWVLYEKSGTRPGSGPGGLIIGTPESLESADVVIGAESIKTGFGLPRSGGEFAFAFYENHILTENFTGKEATREYFRCSADSEAAQLGEILVDKKMPGLPELKMNPARAEEMKRAFGEMLLRSSEVWNPVREILDFPWAARLPGGPLRAAIFARRWAAWDTMELARRLDIDVKHLYFDIETSLTGKGWTYYEDTGLGQLPGRMAELNAVDLADDSSRDLFIVAGIWGEAMPEKARLAIMKHVAEGKGLVIVGGEKEIAGWNSELFSEPCPELAREVLSSFGNISRIPGYRKEDRASSGRRAQNPVKAYRWGAGRVIHLEVKLSWGESVAPTGKICEGLDAAFDRCLAVAARAAVACAGREMASSTSEAETVLFRFQDDLGRVLSVGKSPTGTLPDFPRVAGREVFRDVAGLNHSGETVYMESSSRDFTGSEEGAAAIIKGISIKPSSETPVTGLPEVLLPRGGEASFTAELEGVESGVSIKWRVTDIFGRLLAEAVSAVRKGQKKASVSLMLPPPVTAVQMIDVSAVKEEREVAFDRLRFTMPLPPLIDDYRGLFWTFPGGEPVLRKANRATYDLGADICDLANLLNCSDADAARHYSVAASSGLRLLPYVTRIAGEAGADNRREPCMRDPKYLEEQKEMLAVSSRQAAPYSPVAYTLGDENFITFPDFELVRHSAGAWNLFKEQEVCHCARCVESFRDWLKGLYGDISALNKEWASCYEELAEIKPALIQDAAFDPESFAPWIDHKLFMDRVFIEAHEALADEIRLKDPGALVGWDGPLSYTWRSGYDFAGLAANLELNQTYSLRWLQGELMRSFKRPGYLTGKWGNIVADNEEGWRAFPWDGLFGGDNSVWWWMIWFCAYSPFNPDFSLNNFGKWFFEELGEICSGVGRMLLNAGRSSQPVAVLYSQRDLFASSIIGRKSPDEPYSGDEKFLQEHRALLRMLADGGHDYSHVTCEDIESGRVTPDKYRVLFMPLSACVSEEAADELKKYVSSGGTLISNGRPGILTGRGRIRESRPLDDLFGVNSPSGIEAVFAKTASVSAEINGRIGSEEIRTPEASWTVFEPGMTLEKAHALGSSDGCLLGTVNKRGKGLAVNLNFSLSRYNSERVEPGEIPMRDVVLGAVRSAGVRSPADVSLPEGGRALCLRTVEFGDGPTRYLGIQQDFLARDIAPQRIRVVLPEKKIVYDVRSGRQVGTGKIDEWEAVVSRGRPLLYALLPREIAGVEVHGPASVSPGGSAAFEVKVKCRGGNSGTHVVRMDVYTPGVEKPHRQYSCNILCPRGRGTAEINLALNDPEGEWRLVFRDVASGSSTAESLSVSRSSCCAGG